MAYCHHDIVRMGTEYAVARVGILFVKSSTDNTRQYLLKFYIVTYYKTSALISLGPEICVLLRSIIFNLAKSG